MRRVALAAALVLVLSGCPQSLAPTTPSPTTPQVTGWQTDVRPGSFCSPHGAEGRTVDGTAMRCTTAPDDSRDRWRENAADEGADP